MNEKREDRPHRQMTYVAMQPNKSTAKKRQEKASRITLLRLRSSAEDLYFASASSAGFYEAVGIYYDLIRPQMLAEGSYALDSYADAFDFRLINKTVYSALCNAIPYHKQISQALEFDFAKRTLTVSGTALRGHQIGSRITYRLQDIDAAMDNVTDWNGERPSDWRKRFDSFMGSRKRCRTAMTEHK